MKHSCYLKGGTLPANNDHGTCKAAIYEWRNMAPWTRGMAEES